MTQTDLYQALLAYTPKGEQEERDLAVMLDLCRSGGELLGRDWPAHFTASAWVVSPDRNKVLMAYHNQYDSWAWLGGHADGEADLLAVARKEAEEESGAEHVRVLSPEILSVEILPVNGHVKRGRYVSTHLHLNVTYLLEAPETDALRCKPDENSGVRWLAAEEVPEVVREENMIPIYRKLMERVEQQEHRKEDVL